jgi:hypothetical protein
MGTLQSWLAAALVLAGAVGPQAQEPRPELPEDARQALTARWAEEWSLPSALEPPCGNDGVTAPLTTTDLDNDGRQDLVAVIQTPDGVRLVAMLYRLTGYEIFDLDALAGEMAGVVMLAPRGARFSPARGPDDFFPASTIVVRQCDGAATGYLWSGITFRRIAITR